MGSTSGKEYISGLHVRVARAQHRGNRAASLSAASSRRFFKVPDGCAQFQSPLAVDLLLQSTQAFSTDSPFSINFGQKHFHILLQRLLDSSGQTANAPLSQAEQNIFVERLCQPANRLVLLGCSFSSSAVNWDLYEKVAAGERISDEEALRLFESKDLNVLGAIADLVRQRKVGHRASYILNPLHQLLQLLHSELPVLRFCAQETRCRWFQYSIGRLFIMLVRPPARHH